MEKSFRSTGSKLFPKSTTFITILLLLTTTSSAISNHELDTAIRSLRSTGYTLFSNAIATSDLRFLLTSSINSSFTLFAPHDPLLFTLDISSSASHYVRTLRYHVASHRFSTSDLRNLSESSNYLDTLLPHHGLVVCKRKIILNGVVADLISVDGIRILVPDLYLGSGIAVHGLGGILDPKFNAPVDLPGELGFVSPWTPSGGCLSPHPHRLNPKQTVPEKGIQPDVSRKSCSGKRRKHHKKHGDRKENRRGSHGHRHVDNEDDHIDEKVWHRNFSKFNHQDTL